MRVSDPSPMARFVRSVHRRHLLLRLGERAGLGTLAGAAAAVVLIAVMAWRGWPGGGTAAFAAVGAGALLGLVWGVVRRPRPLEAAVAADRQLGLEDLLGTALVMRRQLNGSDDPWAAAVLAVAEDRCRGLSPAAVSLRRLGGRAWGGIGLVTALAVVLALFTSTPADRRAAGDQANAGPAAPDRRPNDRPEHPLLIVPVSVRHAALPGVETDSSADGRPGAPSAAEPPHAGPTKPDTTTPDASPNDPPSGSPNPGGTGSSGAGQTHPKDPNPVSTNSPPVVPGTNPPPRQPNPAGRPAAGGAGVARVGDGNPPAAAAGGTAAAGGVATARNTPPWDTDGWPSDVRRARQAVDAGQVPPAYRDIVRQYFERP